MDKKFTMQFMFLSGWPDFDEKGRVSMKANGLTHKDGQAELCVGGHNKVLDEGPFYHGTKAQLKVGDVIEPGYSSNYGKRVKANFVYMSATMNAAIWGAELAVGDGPQRIYIVEPLGVFENDPNLTDKKFPGNPTRSYRTRDGLRIIGEVVEWTGHTPEELKTMKDALQKLKEQGVEAIND